MRIVYVVDSYPELSQTFVSNEVQELRRQGVDVSVVTLKQGDAMSAAAPADLVLSQSGSQQKWLRVVATCLRHPITFSKVCRTMWVQRSYITLTLKCLPALFEWAGSMPVRPDRIHTHFAWGASSIAVYLGKILGCPVSMTVHARDLFVRPKRLQEKIDAMDLVITVCEFNRRWLRAHQYDAHRVEVVACGVEVPETVSRTRSLEIVSIGRLVPKKGIDILIRAIALLKADGLLVSATIIGDGPEMQKLQTLILRSGTQDQITMMGSLKHEDALDVLGKSTLFVLPCRVDDEGDSDALPVVLREAMAREVAVISTNIGGIPETIRPESGWVVEAESPTLLAEAIKQAILEPVLRQTKAQNAREQVVEEYTLAGTVQHLLTVLQSS